MLIDDIPKISRLWLASVVKQTGLSLIWSHMPGTGSISTLLRTVLIKNNTLLSDKVTESDEKMKTENI